MKNHQEINRSPYLRRKITAILFFFLGLASLAWFMVRVIPKPSRASYPCMQAAFPLASAFVLWLTGMAASGFLFVKAKTRWNRSKFIMAIGLFLIAVCILMVTSTINRYTPAVAQAYLFAGNLLGRPYPVMHDFTREDSCVVEPSAIVSIVKSIQPHAEDISSAEIVSMVTEAIEKVGGLDDIVSDGDTVILKPNLVISVDGTANPQQLSPEVNGVTTDYRVVQAVVNIVRELNPSGKIYVMEGSAVGATANNMTILNYGQITGIDSLVCLDEIVGAWGDTNSFYLQGVSLLPGKALYVGANNRYWLHKLYYNADVVISIPVLKNHCYAGTTGSVKNVGIGATPEIIYAPDPNSLRWNIDHENPPRTNLHYFIHDYYMCRPVDFVVMDGLQSIQNGPASTSTTQQLSDDQMNMRLILAGKDPVAVDAIGALLMGHDPQLIPHLVTLHNDSLGCCDARLIRVIGNKVGDEKRDFEIFDTGILSKYDDFEPPYFAVDECYIIGNQLHFSLTVDEEVTKVEVSIDGTYLNQVVICSFNDFSIELDTFQINQGTQITVYAYDQYLNYSSEVVIYTFEPEPEMFAGNELSLSVAPNSAADQVVVTVGSQQSAACPEGEARRISSQQHVLRAKPEGSTVSSQISLTILDLFGRELRTIIDEMNSQGEYTLRLDVSDLPAGVYLVRLQTGGESVVRKLIVQ